MAPMPIAQLADNCCNAGCMLEWVATVICDLFHQRQSAREGQQREERFFSLCLGCTSLSNARNKFLWIYFIFLLNRLKSRENFDVLCNGIVNHAIRSERHRGSSHFMTNEWKKKKEKKNHKTRSHCRVHPEHQRKSNKSLINIKSENLIKNDKISKCSADNCRVGEEKTRKSGERRGNRMPANCAMARAAEFFDLISRARRIASAAVWRANKRAAGDVTEHAFHCFWSFSKFPNVSTCMSARISLVCFLVDNFMPSKKKATKNGNYYKATGNRSLLLFSTHFFRLDNVLRSTIMLNRSFTWWNSAVFYRTVNCTRMTNIRLTRELFFPSRQQLQSTNTCSLWLMTSHSSLVFNRFFFFGFRVNLLQANILESDNNNGLFRESREKY